MYYSLASVIQMLVHIHVELFTGEVVNVKYRTLDKRFRQVKGADKILYGLDDVVGQDTIIIVEGMLQRHAQLNTLNQQQGVLPLKACMMAPLAHPMHDVA